jgi:hypothetical protein
MSAFHRHCRTKVHRENSSWLELRYLNRHAMASAARRGWRGVVIAVVLVCATSAPLRTQLTSTGCSGQPASGQLSLWLMQSDLRTGQVQVNGLDSRRPNQRFAWSWGDGDSTQGFFPQNHVYGVLTRDGC